MSLATQLFDLGDDAATAALGAALATRLAPGDVIFLIGDLGAGKTSLARGVIHALTGERDAPSPTFSLVQAYDAPAFTLWHFDFYRLDSPEQIVELGFDEALDGGVSLIEWPDRLGGFAPDDRLEIRLEAAGSGRRATLTGYGSWNDRLEQPLKRL